jgi:histidinol-phosphate aminotransferase
MSNLPLDRLVPGHIRLFEPYYPSPPDQELMRLYRLDHLHRLNNNENALGPPPAVREMIQAIQAGAIPVYPNGDSRDLRHALAKRFDKTSGQFLIGNGSCELISSVVKAFCEGGDNIITADKTFAVYEWVSEFSGLEARLVPLKEYGFDPDAMLAARDERTKIIFVCNPNNPTGTYWDREILVRFLDIVGGEQIVVLDEAYFEYVAQADYPDGMQLLEAYPNLIVFRTFSKMYALAALRVGLLCASEELVDIVRRTHVAYSVNTLGQQAAVEALRDDGEFIAKTRAMVVRGKQRLSALFSAMGFEYLAGEGNYMMVKTPMSDTLLHRKLLRQGLMVRTMTGFRFPNWIRISLVQEPIMEEFCTAFQSVFQKS